MPESSRGRNETMTEATRHPTAPSDLRRLAEEKARAIQARLPETPSPEEAGRLIHELQVHKIELELQNEELRRAQGELEASRARYFDLYDLAPVGYFSLGEQGLILEANLAGAGLLGLARRDLIHQPISRYIFPEDQDVYYRHRRQLLETDTRPGNARFACCARTPPPFGLVWSRSWPGTAKAAIPFAEWW
jgi:two-component system, cell cycle sensor histidine kinase and response regulator CckA